MSNCLECGRLISPSSGITGPNTSKIFCCRRCLRSYYDEHPGLWEAEEETVQFYLDEAEYQAEQQRLLDEQHQQEYTNNVRKNTIIRWSIFCVLLLIALSFSSLWSWLIFIIYTLWMIGRWSSSQNIVVIESLNINMRLRELIIRYEWLKFWFIWQFIFNVLAWLIWIAYYFFDIRVPSIPQKFPSRAGI